MSNVISYIFVIGFTLLYLIFYGFGAAIQNLNISKLEHDMEEGSKKAAQLLHIVNRPTRFINSIQIGTNVAGMALGAVVLKNLSTAMIRICDISDIFSSELSMIIATAITGALLLMVIICFGIIIPKRFAARNPERWGYALLPWIRGIILILLPFSWIITGLCWLVLKLCGIDMNASGDSVTEEDIMSMVNEGHEQGVLEASEAEMITNIFELDDKTAADVMTHRVNVVGIDAADTLKDAITFILTEGNNSRYPVYEKDIDNVIGILHMRDALVCQEKEGQENRSLKEIPGLLREAHFIPETRSLNILFKEMQSHKIHMEVVVDEYGQTSGIVTMEDILEEIVGNILDEYDVDEEYILERSEGEYIIAGMTPLEEVQKVLGIEFTEDDFDTYDTLNGFLISKLNRIPEENEAEEVEYAGYIFKILRVENKKVHTVRVIKRPLE